MAAVLSVEALQTHFFTREGVVRAVDGVSFEVAPGRILGLVGESGSGKTVTGFSVIGLVDPPGRIVGGRILYKGEDLVGRGKEAMRALRGSRIAMIFQDPMMTLNPVLRIDTQMIEALRAHERMDKATARRRARDALGMVGLPSPEERLRAYPHQLSGGMRQRVAIAIAMLHRPDLIIADEPTTALDVTIQGQILFEVQRLCRESGTALIWITHDLAVVAGLADEVCVMYAGKVVEQGGVDEVLDAPLHPYTRGLLESVPAAQPTRRAAAPDPRHDALAPRSAAGLRVPGPLRARRRGVRRHAGDARRRFPAAACAASIRTWAGRDAAGDGASSRSSRSRSASSSRIDAAARIANLFGAGYRVEVIHAVDGVSLAVHDQGEVVGLVGESGCGKSTIGRMVAGMLPPSEGRILHRRPRRVLACRPRKPRRSRSPSQMVFQDPFASLNPRMRVGDIIGEAPRLHGLVPAAQRRRLRRRAPRARRPRSRPQAALSAPVLRRPAPAHRHRARARRCNPEVLVCDEAVAALDVSIQAQILNLLPGPAREPAADLSLHQPRPGGGRAPQRPRRDHVPGPHRREPRRPRSCSPARTIPTRRRCSRRFPDIDRAAQALSSRSRARSRRRSTRRPAVTSTRAARTRWRAAARSGRP